MNKLMQIDDFVSVHVYFYKNLNVVYKLAQSAPTDFLPSVAGWYLDFGKAITISLTSPWIPML